MNIEPCEQRTDEWFNLRAGKPSASNFSKILTPKGKPSDSAQPYAEELAIERLFGVDREAKEFRTYYMDRGNRLEVDAIECLRLLHRYDVTQVGLVLNDLNEYLCSPDGLILNLKMGVEIKCLSRKEHIEVLKRKAMPTKHIPQVQGGMLVTGYEKWLFLAYHPVLPSYIETINRDSGYISKLQTELTGFNYTLEAEEAKLRRDLS